MVDVTSPFPSLTVVCVNACSIKGDVKEHFSPCTGGAIFSATSSLLTIEDACLVSCPWGWVWVVPYQQVHLPGCDDAERFLKLGKRWGCTVPTMVLSETRGL